MIKELNQLFKTASMTGQTIDDLADTIIDYLMGEEIDIEVRERIQETLNDLVEECETFDDFSKRAKPMLKRHLSTQKKNMKFMRSTDDDTGDEYFDVDSYE